MIAKTWTHHRFGWIPWRVGIAGLVIALAALGGCSGGDDPEPEEGEARAKASDSGSPKKEAKSTLSPADDRALKRVDSLRTSILPLDAKYRMLQTTSKQEGLSEEVRGKVTAYMEQLEEEIREETFEDLRPFEVRAELHVKRGRLSQAIQEYESFEASFPQAAPLFAERLAKAKKKIRDALEEKLTGDMKKINEARKEERFDEALDLARRIFDYADEETTKKAEGLVAEIESARKAKEDEEERKEKEALAAQIAKELEAAAKKDESGEGGTAEGGTEEGGPTVAEGSTEGEGPAVAEGGTEGEGPVLPDPGTEGAPSEPAVEPTGDPFVGILTLSSRDRKTGRFTVRPKEKEKSDRRKYYLEIPEEAVCHADMILTTAQLKKTIKADEPVVLYAKTFEQTRSNPYGGSFSLYRIQFPDAIAFGPMIAPDRSYENPRLKDAEWHEGKAAEPGTGPFEIVIKGRAYELLDRPRNGCLFKRTEVEANLIRRGVVFVVGELTDVPPEGSSRIGSAVIRARACLVLQDRLLRLPVYGALYKNYDPSRPAGAGG